MSDLVAQGYGEFIDRLKSRVRDAQLRAGIAANRELVLLYWSIGRDILAEQAEHGWGAKVVERLSADLRREFPGLKGLSFRNLKYMRAFAEAWPDEAFVQAALARLSWYHNIAIIEKIKAVPEREWYARSAFEHGWSRNVLVLQIEGRLYERSGKAVSNFGRTLPAPDSDLARQTLKDPYLFDFLTLDTDAREREVEQGLMQHVERFLLELGTGFAFVGRQVHVEVAGHDFYLDMLFYHLRLRRFVVVELKAGPFQAEYAGKLNFYLSAVDDLMRHPSDGPSIGLLLCKSKDRVLAEYALRDMSKPIGVADWQTRLIAALPEGLEASLPTVEDLEAELSSLNAPDAGGRKEGDDGHHQP